VPEKVKSALRKAQERRERVPGDADDAGDRDFKKRLEKVLQRRTIDMLKFAEGAGWHLFSAGSVQGMEEKHFITCPFSEEHTGGGSDDSPTDTYIFERTTSARFKWGFHCSHHSCADRKIIDVLELAKTESPELFTESLDPDRNVTADFGAIPDMAVPEDAPKPVLSEAMLVARPNDVDNAHIFATLFKDTMRYLHDEKVWLFWSGSRWCRDTTQECDRRAKVVCDHRVAAVGKDEAMIQQAKHSGSALAIKSLLRLSQSTLPIASNGGDFDTNLMWFGCANGVIDLTTGALMPPKPSQMISLHSPVFYRPDALCPAWETFLSQVFRTTPEVIPFMQRWLGYNLTADVSAQAMVILYGTGMNGKSTMMDVISAIVGDYGIASPQALLIASKNPDPNAATPELAQLRKKRMSFVNETDSSAPLAGSKMKVVTSTEVFSCRLLHGNNVNFKPSAKVTLATNHKPLIRDPEDGLWRRLFLVPFLENFKGRADSSLGSVLHDEREGILAWMVRGCLQYQEMGLAAPESVLKETEEYRGSEDVLGTFISENMVKGDLTDKTPLKKTYEAYFEWARDSGLNPWSKITFNRRMKDKNMFICRVDGFDHWRGWTLRTENQPDLP